MDGKFLSREEFLAKAFELRPLICETPGHIENRFNSYYHHDVENTFVGKSEFDKRKNKWNFHFVEMNFIEIFNKGIKTYGINDVTFVYPYGFNVGGMPICNMKLDPKIHIPRKDKTHA